MANVAEKIIRVRVRKNLADWLFRVSRQTGVSASHIVSELLLRARLEHKSKPYMLLAGAIKGPRDLSTRKGFDRGPAR